MFYSKSQFQQMALDLKLALIIFVQAQLKSYIIKKDNFQKVRLNLSSLLNYITRIKSALGSMNLDKVVPDTILGC